MAASVTKVHMHDDAPSLVEHCFGSKRSCQMRLGHLGFRKLPAWFFVFVFYYITITYGPCGRRCSIRIVGLVGFPALAAAY